MDLEKEYGRVKREALWQVLRMSDDGGKLLNGLVCEVRVDGTRVEYVSEFKYFWSVFHESGIDYVVCCRKLSSWRKFSGTIKSW